MPIAAALPLILGAAGAGLSAFGGSGKQGSTQSNQTTTSNQTGTQTPNEDPMFTMFRRMLLPAIGQEYQKAQQPVYGDVQKAQYLNDANEVFNTQADNLSGQLARRGALNSGAGPAGYEPFAGARASNISNFFSQIPMLNENARSSRVNNLLGLATNFLGRSPVGQTTTQTGTQTGQGTNTQFGPSFGSGFMNNLGGMFGMGSMGQGPFGNLGGSNPFELDKQIYTGK